MVRTVAILTLVAGAWLAEAGTQASAVAGPTASGASKPGPVIQLTRGRVGGSTWSLLAFARRHSSPLPGDDDRRVTALCVSLKESPSEVIGSNGERSRLCRHPDFPDDPHGEFIADRGCRPIGLSVLGFVRPGVRGIVAVLGDGRRIRARLVALPRSLGGGRAFVLILARKTALRRLVAVEHARPRVLLRGIPPGVIDCAGGSGLAFYEPDDPDRGERGTKSEPLEVRDDGVLVCASLGRPPARDDCFHPPVRTGQVLRGSDGSGTTVAGVLPGHVAAVELELDRGERLSVPATTAGPYAGRYAGLLRFFSIALPGRRLVHQVHPYDERGRLLRAWDGPDPLPFVLSPVLLGRARSGWQLGGAMVDGDEHSPCLQLSRGRLRTGASGCAVSSPALVGVTVPCRPRAAFVWGVLPSRARRVLVESSLGGVPGRIVSLRQRLGFDGRAFLVALPARARPRALVFPGLRRDRHPLLPPAATEQCGYSDAAFLPGLLGVRIR